jgi:hypothetical protein
LPTTAPNTQIYLPSFLDPKQLAKAQHLAKIHSVTESYSANNLATSVTMFLQALRECAFQAMLKKWEQGELHLTAISMWMWRVKISQRFH